MIISEATIEELQQLYLEIGEPSYRAEQTFRRIHKHLAEDLDEFTEHPKRLRDYFFHNHLFPKLELRSQEISSEEGNQKFIFEYHHKKKSFRRIFESVWLVRGNRRTACISSQSGCSLNCIFCATGTLPFRGNLKTWQIVQQVYRMIRFRNRYHQEKLTNIVFMGMGEPFYNYDNVIKSALIFHHPLGLNIGARHITISTAGVVPMIERFIQEKQPFTLAISLNHPDSIERGKLMDINTKYPLKELIRVAKEYVKYLKKRITFEYILIPEINMSKMHIKELIAIVKEVKFCKVNLIPLNTQINGWRAPTPEEVFNFQRILREHDILTFYRGSQGKSIYAACGMLALQTSKNK